MDVFLSIVLPAYNEEGAIEGVILDHLCVLEELSSLVPRREIVCVDDGSTDQTPQILEQLQARIPELRVIRHEKNQGIYASFTRLYQEARGTHIYSTGSDGQWPAQNIPRLFEQLITGADLVVGVRENRREVYGLQRQIVSFAFNFLPKILFGVKTCDAGSVKLGRREVFTLPLISRSPFAEAERIIKAYRSGYKVDFIPIRFQSRSAGRAKGASWKNIAASTRDLFHCLRVYGLRNENQRYSQKQKNRSFC